MNLQSRMAVLAILISSLAGCNGQGSTSSSSDGSTSPVASVSPGKGPAPTEPRMDTGPRKGAPAPSPGEGKKMPEVNTDEALREKIKSGLVARTVPKGRGTGGWSAGVQTPLRFAERLDARMSSLNRAVGGAEVIGVRAQGYTRAIAKISITNPKSFEIQYITFLKTERAGAAIVTMRREGAQMSILGQKGFDKPFPASKAPYPNKEQMLAEWTENFSRMIFAGLGTGRTPVTDLVTAAMNPRAKLTLITESRSVEVAGRAITNERLFIERNATDAKKLGEFQMEIVVDTRSGLPTAIRIWSETPDEKPFKSEWKMTWDLSRPDPGEMLLPPKRPNGTGA